MKEDKENSAEKKQYNFNLDARTLIDILADYDVVTTDFTGSENVGEVDFDERVIYLKRKQSPAEKKRTLIHEIVHILCDGVNIELSEKSVDKVANALYDSLYKNQI